MTAPLSDLKSHLGFWMRTVSNSVSHAFARKLKTEEFIVAEWVLLRELHGAGPTAPTPLAGQMGMTKGAITKLADRLGARGYVARLADPRDGRAQILTITPKALDILPVLAALADRNDEEFFGDLDPSERETLARLLKKIVEKRGITTVPVE